VGDVLIRLVALAGAAEGRGHLARALALGEALSDALRVGASGGADGSVELQLVRGEPTRRERAQAEAAELALVPVGAAVASGSLVVVDLPNPDDVAGAFDPGRLVVFDDGNRFQGQAALVVQPSLEAWTGPGRASRVLAGYRYVPVASVVRRARTAGRGPGTLGGGSRRVLVCFGGADPGRVTERLVPALASIRGVELDVVVGASYAGPVEGWPIGPDRDPSDFVERMATADLVVGSAGTIKFEIACVGRPAVLLAVADDQLPVGPPFAATGAAVYFGDGRTVDPSHVAEAVAALLADDARRASLASTAAAVVDGRGADRLAAEILALDG
jgi:spore coat polysaccharide biosynthesis predicted glycosyltransferase SpsG